jgi:hypothetical protein
MREQQLLSLTRVSRPCACAPPQSRETPRRSNGTPSGKSYRAVEPLWEEHMSRVVPAVLVVVVAVTCSCGKEPEEAAPAAVESREDALGGTVPCQWYSTPPGPLIPYGPIPGYGRMVCPSWAFKNTTVALYNASYSNWTAFRVSAGFWYQEFSLSPGQQYSFPRFYAAAPITIDVISGNPGAAAAF